MSKVIAVIPVHGRIDLARETVSRLNRQEHKLYKIVLIGDGEQERQIAIDNNCDFIDHSNVPLSFKWQAGVDCARMFKPDAILILGSDNWISDNWISEGLKHINDYDVIGKNEIYFINIAGKMHGFKWSGYLSEDRRNEPIGAGRIISKNILNKISWQLWDRGINRLLDKTSFKKLKEAGARVKLMEDKNIFVMDIKGKWDYITNMESMRVNCLGREDVSDMYSFLGKMFPDYKERFNNILKAQDA